MMHAERKSTRKRAARISRAASPLTAPESTSLPIHSLAAGTPRERQSANSISSAIKMVGPLPASWSICTI